MEELIRQSTLLRDMIETDIQNTANDLEAQRLAVNYAFRNRIHEVWLGLPRDFFAFVGTNFEINQGMGWELGCRMRGRTRYLVANRESLTISGTNLVLNWMVDVGKWWFKIVNSGWWWWTSGEILFKQDVNAFGLILFDCFITTQQPFWWFLKNKKKRENNLKRTEFRIFRIFESLWIILNATEPFQIAENWQKSLKMNLGLHNEFTMTSWN